ncbi:MAG: hypothetical protein U1F23_02960 [Lysobacterales bacterium]
MHTDPSSKPLSVSEIEELFDEAAREVEADRAAGIDINSKLPPKLLKELEPSIRALDEIFNKRT